MTNQALLSLIKELGVAVGELQQLKTEANKISKVEENVSSLHSKLIKELEHRDVVQRGNFGWENRTANFLIQLLSTQEESLT